MKVGFIGLGVQGRGLAANALAGGFEVTVFDLNRKACDELASLGASVAASSAEVAHVSDVIQVCVLNDAQLKDVVSGSKGLLAGARQGTIIAVHSTVRPDTVIALGQQAQAVGVELIDAPVSGGANGAKAKTMSYMIGGSEAALDTCRPLFLASGDRITYIGPLGSGMKAKLAHQAIIAINILAAFEGMRLGTAAGLPAQTLEKVVREGGAQSYICNKWSSLVLGPQSPAVFYKDLQLCIELAHSLGISVPGVALTQQLLDTLLADRRHLKEQAPS